MPSMPSLLMVVISQISTPTSHSADREFQEHKGGAKKSNKVKK